MVYTGKPSRACATCKQRRIKCDEGRPKCGQCIKSRRECSGYKTETDLMFRDETESTATRATRKKPNRTVPVRSSSSSGRPSSKLSLGDLAFAELGTMIYGGEDFDEVVDRKQANGKWYLGKVASPNPILSLSLQSRAIAYFFNHFTVHNSQHSFHIYGILSELYMKAMPEDTIRQTTDAVCMITFSRRPGLEIARPDAARAYVNAVRQVAAAVADPVQVKQNETLLSILMLSFAETVDIAAVSHRSFATKFTPRPKSNERGIVKFHTAWAAHASGAEHVIRARGLKSMTDSENSMSLALMVRLHVVQKHIFLAQPINNLDDVWLRLDVAENNVDLVSGISGLSGLSLEIPLLRYRGLVACRMPMHPGLGHQLKKLLADINDLDGRFHDWYLEKEAWGLFRIAGYYVEPVLRNLGQEPVWPGAVLNFDSVMVMNAIKLYHEMRLYLQMIIFNVLERLVEPDLLEAHPDFIACQKVIELSVNGICAIVPYGMGYLQGTPLSPTPVSSPLGTFVTPGLVPAFVQQHQERQRQSSSPIDFNYGIDPSIPGPTSSSQTNDAPSLPTPPPVGFQTFSMEEDAPAIGPWYLSLPLYIAYSMITVPSEQKDWIRGRLRFIADCFGISQASVYADADKVVYKHGERRRLRVLDFAPLPWQPLQ